MRFRALYWAYNVKCFCPKKNMSMGYDCNTCSVSWGFLPFFHRVSACHTLGSFRYELTLPEFSKPLLNLPIWFSYFRYIFSCFLYFEIPYFWRIWRLIVCLRVFLFIFFFLIWLFTYYFLNGVDILHFS